MSKFLCPLSLMVHQPLTISATDYVIVVFGISAIFIGAYWIVNGSVFVGPVSVARFRHSLRRDHDGHPLHIAFDGV